MHAFSREPHVVEPKKARASGRRTSRALVCLGIASLPADVFAHEAWLLTPTEISELATRPIPEIFTDTWPLAALVAMMIVAAVGAVGVAHALADHEERLFAGVRRIASRLGPFFVRIGLALMLGLGAVGALPRNGTAPWTTPTLMVPDMQLAIAGGQWDWLAQAQLLVAVCLLLGVATRLAAVGVIALVCLGFAAFGSSFLAYGPHFIAPAMILLVYGAGALSVDALLQGIGATVHPFARIQARWTHILWRLILAQLGGTFVYLGIVFKLGQPTLLMAILEHGDMPTFGIPIEWIALIMMLVEITAGMLLALGLLVRPVALFLIGAFTFFALTIGETPLFHANLYGAMAMLLMAGRESPTVEDVARRPKLLFGAVAR